MPINQDALTTGATFQGRNANQSEVVKVRCRADSGFPIEVNVKSLHGAEKIPIAIGESEVFRVNGGIKEIKVNGVGGTAKVDVFAVGNL